MIETDEDSIRSSEGKALHTRVLGFIPSGNFLLEPLTITDAKKLIIHKYVSNLFQSFMKYVGLPLNIQPNVSQCEG